MSRGFWLVAGLVVVVGFVAGLTIGRDPQPPAATQGEGIALPSGLRAELQEMIWNRPGQGLTYRFRFVAAGFSETQDVEMVMADLHYLCTNFALDRLANTGPMPGQVIVSLADRPSEFGTFDPDVTQVFEAFRIENGTCIWEVF